MNATQIVTPDSALAWFLEVWGSSLAGDLATKLTCGEADAIARLHRECGYKEEAAAWIREHAETDDEGDEHYISPEKRLMTALEAISTDAIELSEEDPECFGIGHLVLRFSDVARFAILETTDRPSDDPDREVIGWTGDAETAIAPGEWEVSKSGETKLVDVTNLINAATEWAATISK